MITQQFNNKYDSWWLFLSDSLLYQRLTHAYNNISLISLDLLPALFINKEVSGENTNSSYVFKNKTYNGL